MKSKGKSVRLTVQLAGEHDRRGTRSRRLPIEAKSAEDAIKYAIRTYAITDAHQQSRVGAYRVA